MIACPNCQQESPDESRHCVHCGHRFGEHQETQFGMPSIRPSAPAPASEKGAAQTTQFGAEDLARLAAAAEEAADDEGGKDRRSLLAGLPRPPVSSARSPLTNGLAKAVRAPAQAAPSARRTVMGMPIFGTPAPELGEPASEPAPVRQLGAGIVSLESLDDFDSKTPATADRAPPASDPARSDAPVAPDAGFEPTLAMEPVPEDFDAPPPIGGAQDARREAAVQSAPTQPAKPRAPETAPASAVGESVRNRMRGSASTPEIEPAERGVDLFRGLAIVVGLVLLALFAWPIYKAWFWDVLGALEGRPLYTFVGTGVAGAISLLAGLFPLGAGARGAIVILAGLAGAACLIVR